MRTKGFSLYGQEELTGVFLIRFHTGLERDRDVLVEIGEGRTLWSRRETQHEWRRLKPTIVSFGHENLSDVRSKQMRRHQEIMLRVSQKQRLQDVVLMGMHMQVPRLRRVMFASSFKPHVSTTRVPEHRRVRIDDCQTLIDQEGRANLPRCYQ